MPAFFIKRLQIADICDIVLVYPPVRAGVKPL